jgi:DNA-binding response OmpR family regulator
MGDRLLLVEDDDGIRTALRLALSDEQYEVAEAASAEDGLAHLREHDVDAMLVDLMLGGIDGFTFIRKARMLSGSPILVVSALSDTEDIITALEVGADDYVTKPFKVPEIVARLRALRRRSPQPDAMPTEADTVVLDADNGPLVLDRGAGAVRRGAEELHLTTTEYRLLAELADPPGRVLSREVLLERVWERGFFGDERIVDVHIRRLRTKIELDPGSPVLVVTVRGLGYRLDPR